MYKRGNDVLATLQSGIAAGDLAITLTPLAGTSFSMPPAPTDAGAGSYGAPFGLFALVDRLDLSRAKVEIVLYSARAAAGGGAFTYTIPAGGRGWEGSTAQAWPPGSYAIQIATDDMLAMNTAVAVLRSQSTLLHARDGVKKWDGTSFAFTHFISRHGGRGRHLGTAGGFLISMPANGTNVIGHGGAANQAVAAGAIPIPAVHALWYELPINGGINSLDANFRITGITADLVVPPHWIFLAAHDQPAAAGEAILRVGDGSTLVPWREIGAAGNPAFGGAWVNFNAGTHETAAFKKDVFGRVWLKGQIKSGAVPSVAFVLPAGCRPAKTISFASDGNGAYGRLFVDNTGNVSVNDGSNAMVSLMGVNFEASL